MKVRFLGVALVMGLGGSAFAKEQCYGRNYTEAHLARHPHQLVTNVLLKIYDESTVTPPIGWDIRINRRGREKPEYASGLCMDNKDGGRIDLKCFIECDGGSFEVDFQGTSSLLLHLDRIAVNASCAGDSETDLEIVSSGVDDKVFAWSDSRHPPATSSKQSVLAPIQLLRKR